MRLRKYGCALMIIPLVVVFFFLIHRNERKEPSKEMILQEGAETVDIGSNSGKRLDEAENDSESEMGRIANESDKKERPQEILEKGTVLQSDNEFEFYRTDSEEMGCGGTYKGNYIVVHDLKDDFYIYLPDSYETILDIKAERDSIEITYANQTDYITRTIRIPIHFPARTEAIMETARDYNEHDESTGRWIRSGSRAIWSGEEPLENTLSDLPQEVWRKEILMGNEICEITFERISPVYRRLFYESYMGERADYRFVITDESNNTVSEQIYMDFPVAYEETYWIIDFSGDGFADIAFCTGEDTGTHYSRTYFCTLIWNVEKNCYERKAMPEAESDIPYTHGFPLWNEDLHGLIVIVGGDKWEDAILEMYSYENGAWQRMRRLERAYSETEFYEWPGKEELYPEPIGDWELFYENGEETEKKFMESECYDDSVWSKDNEENLKLYPDSWEWETVPEIIGGIEFNKRVRK